jgi:hypothetical protein
LRSINNILGNSRIKIFPNPFTKNFNVAIKPQLTTKASFNLYDALGRLYISKQVSLQAGQNQLIQFNNLQPLQRGIYTLKFSHGQNKQSFKLVVQ